MSSLPIISGYHAFEFFLISRKPKKVSFIKIKINYIFFLTDSYIEQNIYNYNFFLKKTVNVFAPSFININICNIKINSKY